MHNIEKKVKEKIKEYSNEKYLNEYISNEFLDENGDAEIKIKVNNRDKIFNPMTYGNQLDLNERIYNYIEDKAAILDSDIKLNLRIVGGNLSDEDKEKIRKLMKEHYAIELYKAHKEYKRFRSKMYKLAIIGIFFLICYALIAIKFYSNFFVEIFGFLFSFALWQAFETLTNTMSDIRMNREDITQKLIMDIYFDDER